MRKILSSMSLILLLGTRILFANSDDSAGSLHSVETILVKTKQDVYSSEIFNETEAIYGQVAKEYTVVDRLFLIKIPPHMDIEAALAFYRGLSIVEYAEPNYAANLESAELEAVPSHEDSPLSADPLFVNQWALENVAQSGGITDADINANSSWALSNGSTTFAIGVIDSGVDYNHNDLNANLWQNSLEVPGNNIDDDGNGYIDDIYGINAITGTGNPLDDNLHGTHTNGNYWCYW